MEPIRRSLPREVEAVRRVRDDVRAALADAGRPAAHVDAVAYITAELVTEVVEHGAGAIVAVVLTVDAQRTRIEVSDGLALAGGAPIERKVTLYALASQAGVDDISGGRMLWAEIVV